MFVENGNDFTNYWDGFRSAVIEPGGWGGDSTFIINPTAAWNFVQKGYETKPTIYFDPNFYITPMDLTVESSFKKEND